MLDRVGVEMDSGWWANDGGRRLLERLSIGAASQHVDLDAHLQPLASATIQFSMRSVSTNASISQPAVIAVWTFVGAFGLFAAILFTILVSDTPQQNAFISLRERHYLEIMLSNQGLKNAVCK